MNDTSMRAPFWPVLGCRWAARLTGVLLVAFLAVFVVGHGGLPNVLAQPFPVQLESLAMFLMVCGFLSGWRWEGLGSILALGGFALFVGTEIATNGRLPGGAIPYFVIPGLLLLASYWVSARAARQGQRAE